MKTTQQSVLVAADGGGTGCRACAGTIEAGILGQAEGGPGNVHSNFENAIRNLTGAVTEALQQADLGHVPLDQITAHFGVAGAHSDVEMEAVRAALPYGRSSVTGDRATSVRGALGDTDGYVVALGTGTIVARQKALGLHTVGGWGFDISDQASGSWLGRHLLEQIVMAEDGLRAHSPLTEKVLSDQGGLIDMIYFASSAAPGDFAKLARDVIEHAAQGDAVGQELMKKGADYIIHCLRTLGFQTGDQLALAGGVGPHYRNYLPAEMVENVIKPRGTALDGAFAMAWQTALANT
ncbi:ATPase, BadF/BadG/BcrA/BcrD type [Sulfitobacter noctilucicola]|uniref:Glucosamine kinase n=1 Tax=Sulfitobacter noctilucicola TaxID=1342301 RepID=A0A7W6MA58_9RHOB|nr:BadF/BadG/BcrA/BcrD ATPase family protein [Sulfitobacter noctilucicola]KIN63647.1 ATPase, BadF/BadG/BcrA/BcrD type [Sulfitobacter noctilucicola]MBB4174843.1 glucosamine kinase [Sulfitobacter noctilucicola]